jgi:hypothetical protein
MARLPRSSSRLINSWPAQPGGLHKTRAGQQRPCSGFPTFRCGNCPYALAAWPFDRPQSYKGFWASGLFTGTGDASVCDASATVHPSIDPDLASGSPALANGCVLAKRAAPISGTLTILGRRRSPPACAGLESSDGPVETSTLRVTAARVNACSERCI